MKFARRLFLIIFTISAIFSGGGTYADPLALLGWKISSDLKSWTPIPVAFTSLEVGLMVVAAAWLFRDASQKRKHPFVPGALYIPILWLCAALALEVLWGMHLGGVSTTTVGFELRGFAMMVVGYLMVGMLLRDEHDLAMVVRGTLIACTVVVIDNLYRFYVILGAHIPNDLVYDHDDSVVLGFGFILCLALLAFRGTRGQRVWAGLLLPLIIWCMMAMQRRAAFAVLAVGCLMFAILLYRLRPKVFWYAVPALSLILGIYLAAFWHSESIIGQPARAISSMVSPDPRDAASNQYRDIEHFDIITNIKTSRVLGLGFGQPYIMYWPLPDLSFWPFWHYETHNSVLWIWMDGGIPTFFTFWLVMGAGSYVGGRELARRREAWSLARLRLRGRGTRYTVDARRRARARLAQLRPQVPGAWPMREATTELSGQGRKMGRAARARFDNGATALLTASLCFITMQLTYSYVELGIESSRNMLILGVALGILARRYGLPVRRRRRSTTHIGGTVVPPTGPQAQEKLDAGAVLPIG